MNDTQVVVQKKMNHKQYRALLKKQRRKRIRQQLARMRITEDEEGDGDVDDDDDEDSLSKLDDDTEDTLRWIINEDERISQHCLWLERELKAQIDFQKQKEEKEKQQKEAELSDENDVRLIESTDEVGNERSKKPLASLEESLFSEISTPLEPEEDGPTSNPILFLKNAANEAPVNYGTEQDRHNCPFFLKTGACRFGDRCSRIHNRPVESSTILIPGMYNHFSISEGYNDEYDADIGLEYEDNETYQHFKEFYEDVLPEFKSVGEIVQFKICCNYEPHLRGNVYIQYKSSSEALLALTKFNGRWYAGRQLSCEFTNVTKWRSAICGLFAQKRCPKGKGCNFLHVFRNPRNEFRDSDFDRFSPKRDNHSRRSNRSYHISRYRYSRSRSRSPQHNRHSRHRLRSSSRSPSSSRSKHSHRSRRTRSRSTDRYINWNSSGSDSNSKSSSHTKRYKKKKKKKHKRKKHRSTSSEDSSSN